MRVFYDLTCPFCYLAQPFNKRLLSSGTKLVELPFQAHPEIPAEGLFIGPRHGPMYDNIAVRAKASNLPLKWRDRLPNSRLALAAAEWTRLQQPEKADEVRERLFHAHFAGDRDIGNKAVILDILSECGIAKDEVEIALKDGSAMKMVDDSEKIGRGLRVTSTPSWESGGKVVSGLQEDDVARLAEMEKS